MSDTPRTDRNFIGMQIVPAVFAQQLERELNSSNERIKQLEAERFESTPDGKALTEMLRIVDDKNMTDHIPDAAKMVPDGWQLVPTELTEAMGDAIYKELGSPTDGWYGFEEAYSAMLAAAPKHEGCAA